MKKCLSLVVLLFLALTAQSQESPLAQVQEKMHPLRWLQGHWKGSGWMMNQQGEKMPFAQQEFISYRLNNSILHIEGLGTHGPDTVHHALAIVSFDTKAQRYRFDSYVASGGSQHDARVEVRPDTLIWAMTTPRGVIRYTISLNDKQQWYEIGEFSADGEGGWSRFFEMTLDRQPGMPEVSTR